MFPPKCVSILLVDKDLLCKRQRLSVTLIDKNCALTSSSVCRSQLLNIGLAHRTLWRSISSHLHPSISCDLKAPATRFTSLQRALDKGDLSRFGPCRWHFLSFIQRLVVSVESYLWVFLNPIPPQVNFFSCIFRWLSFGVTIWLLDWRRHFVISSLYMSTAGRGLPHKIYWGEFFSIRMQWNLP